MKRGIEKEFLENCLAKGMSLPEIGRLVGRDPSTVGYWVKRQGLVANGSDRYSAKGPIERDALESMINEGRSVTEIATALDASGGRVRYWIGRYGLEVGSRIRKRNVARARALGERTVELECRKHGRTEFWLGDGRARCRRCNAEAVSERRRKVKRILVAEAGGACLLCGYDRSTVALEFHHVDPAKSSSG